SCRGQAEVTRTSQTETRMTLYERADLLRKSDRERIAIDIAATSEIADRKKQGGRHERCKAETLRMGPRRRRHDGRGAGFRARPLPREILARSVRSNTSAAPGGSHAACAARGAAGLTCRFLHERTLRPRRAHLR